MSMDQEQYQKKLADSRKKLKEISKHLNLATKAGPGYSNREWCCISEVISSIEELQSLISWIAEKKGTKEDSVIISQKLQQLVRIRKVLEKSASESQKYLCHLKKDESTSSFDYAKKENICSYNQQRSIDKCFGSVSSCSASFDPTSSNSSNLYINRICSIPHPTVSQSVGDLMQETEDQHDSLGTAISEDEGLGEESRRGDLTGPNSMLEIRDPAEDVVEPIVSASIRYKESVSPVRENQAHAGWISDSCCQRNSVELCLATISKLKESLHVKEKELLTLKTTKGNENEVEDLQLVICNLQKTVTDLRSTICVMEKQNASLKEQVLELEEAENDARLQGQRLEEKLLFLQEKDSHFQVELAETKHALELCLEELSLKDAEERELQSQLKFMEMLVQKYEEQIGHMESTETVLYHNENHMHDNETLLDEAERKAIEKGTQTCFAFCSEPSVFSNNAKIELQNNSKIFEHDLQELPSCSNFLGTELNACISASKSKDVSVQADICVDIGISCSVQTEPFEHSPANESLQHLICLGCEDSSSQRSLKGNSEEDAFVSHITCPVQKELFTRLHNLVEEDAHLQQQLYQVDQINLTLWQKLHNLQFHIGECQKENMLESGTSNLVASSRETAFSSDNNDDSLKVVSKDSKTCFSSGILNSLGNSEEKLKERLSQLEKINASFQKKLEVREQLCIAREHEHSELMKAEEQLNIDMKSLGAEKDSLVSQVSQLETEKLHLSAEVKKLENELSVAREKHQQEVSALASERDAILADLQKKIDDLLFKEKEYLKQIAKFKSEKPKTESSEFETLKSSYVQLQIELVGHRDKMGKMKQGFEVQLESLQQNHRCMENRVLDELEEFQEKNVDCNKRLCELQVKQKELQDSLKQKEQELEVSRAEFRKCMQTAEEEHKSVEAELRRSLCQMEDETAFATKALTEERLKLEKELQENINDLRCKEELYKSRIMELECNVSQLHTELHRLTGNLHTKFGLEESSDETMTFQREHLLHELQELRIREDELREKLDDMEKKEAAYRETLEHADRIVASVERGYKNKIEELEMSEKSLKQRVGYLEEVENRLRVALHKERQSLDGRTPDDLVMELAEAEKKENSLKEEMASLEQVQRSSVQRIKELEKVREQLEMQVSDREELEAALKKLQHEHDSTRKELLKVKKSENSFQVALHQTESLLETREAEIKAEIQQFTKEKKDLEETISQLRSQVRDLEQKLEKHCVEEETEGETLSQNVPLSVNFQSPLVGMSEQSDESQDATYKNVAEREAGETLEPEVTATKPELCQAENSFRSSTKENLSCLSHLISDMPSFSSEKSGSQLPHVITNKSFKTGGILGNREENCIGGRSIQTLQESPGELAQKPDFSAKQRSGTADNVKRFKEDRNILLLGKVPNETHKTAASSSKPAAGYSQAEKEYCEVRLQLEECMMRAMDAMKMGMRQKDIPLGNEVKGNSNDAILPPANFRVVQQVGSDTVLVGWEYSQTSVLEGFELYVNDQLHETVYAPDRRKAVISGLDLSKPLTLSICAISNCGQISELQTLHLSSSLKPSDGYFFEQTEHYHRLMFWALPALISILGITLSSAVVVFKDFVQ